MSTRLRGKNDYPQTVRLPDSVTRIDTSDPVGAAGAGQIIRNIRSNNFDDVANILTVVGSVQTIDGKAQQAQTVIRVDKVTVLKDANDVEHRLTDPHMVDVYLKQDGMNILGTEEVEIMG